MRAGRDEHFRREAIILGQALLPEAAVDEHEIEIGQFVAAPNSRSGLMNVRSPDYIDRPRLYG